MIDPDDEREGYPAEKARQGRIILDTTLKRGIFIGGLALIVVFVVVMAILT